MTKLFLDIETSGVDPVKHSILSIGIVISIDGFKNYKTFYKEIRYDELVISPDAIAINNFDFRSQKDRIPLEEADKEAFDFIREYFLENDKPQSIGLNIGEFDLIFINKYMPNLASTLNTRSVNLNSLIYLLSDIKSLEFMKLKQDLSEKAAATIEQFSLGLKKHNALYDSLFSLSLYSFIKDSFNLIEK